MDVRYELELSFGSLMAYAYSISKTNEEAKKVIDIEIGKSEATWDSGDSVLTENFAAQVFLGMEAWPKRKPADNEKEKGRLLENTAHKIFDVIIGAWVKTVQRDELVCSLNLFAKVDRNAEIKFFDDFSISVTDLVERWNKYHNESDKIYIQPAFEV